MNYKQLAIALAFTGMLGSCTKDLDRVSPNANSSENLYKTEAGYKASLAKIYGGFALTGNAGPDGSGDLGGIDEGFSSYLRNYWNLQELPTDEAVIAWNDATIKDFHNMSWTPSDVFLRAMYSRIFYQVTLANDFIREADDAKLSSRGITGADADKVKRYRAEARFARALCYLHALDLYGNTTFTTEADKVGAFLPKRGTRAELYAYVETECKALESLLPEPRTNEYGRADKAAVWMILANLYLNAQVYTGTAKYGDALIYAKKVIDQTGYALQADYRHLFLADNHRSNEFIFAVAFDGIRSRTWGGTTYLVHAPVGGDMNPVDFGIDGGWGGLRTTSALVNKFPDPTGLTDRRAQFQLGGQTLDISNVSEFRNGYSIRKWKNVTSTGTPGSNVTWVDTDFPIFRLAEANLIYAEAHLRGGGGTLAEATTLVNALRTRAYGNTSANFSTITLQNVLDERARELHWEAKRRTDLIRYNQFTTADYLWPLKGGSPAGIAVAPHLSIYPIPAAEINTNSNLTQNTGYPR